MERLTEAHKQVLRFLVKSTREKLIPEEFDLDWVIGGPVIAGCGSKLIPAPGVSSLTMDILNAEGLIYSKPHDYGLTGCVLPAGFRAVDNDFSPVQDVIQRRPPIEITESIAHFRQDYPDSTRTAFIMMQFGKTDAHIRIVVGIRAALEPHGMIALRADDKQYNDDLFANIRTYIYGCRFGVAVFERIESEDFNPNVSLEVGYMLGLGKSVCYLKDQTLRQLHTDLVGKIYRPFDPLHPVESIPGVLLPWMAEKGFIAQR